MFLVLSRQIYVKRYNDDGPGHFVLTQSVPGMHISVTRSEERVTKCQFGQSQLLILTKKAVQELKFDISFKTVHNAKVKLWPRKVR